MARYNNTVKTYESMSEEELQGLWAQLYKFMSDVPDRYPVEQWQYGDLDIWPILKGIILLRAARIFHNRQFDLLFIKEAQSEENSFKKHCSILHEKKSFLAKLGGVSAHKQKRNNVNKKAVLELEARSRLVNEMPVDHADILFFGVDVSCFKYGKYLIQNHLDPIRICSGEMNLSSFCYILDHEEDQDFDHPFVVEGVAGFKNTFSKIQSVLAPKHILDTSLLPGFEDFWNAASKIIPLDFLITDKLIQNVYSRTYSTKRALYQFFKYRQTKAVVMNAYYGIFGWAASSAARKLGIPLIDMQHGVAGPPHESYEFEHMPAKGYNTIPTHFFCWSNWETDALNSNAQGNYKAYNIGQSWALTNVIMSSEEGFKILPASRIESARIGLLDIRQSLLLSEQYIASSESERPVYSILIALQDEKDMVWLKDLFAEPNNWQFYLRLHPATVRNEAAFNAALKKYENENANIRLASTAPLDFLLPHMDVVVTHYSSTVLDGNAFGVPGICYGEAGRWYYDRMGESAPEFCKQSFASLFNCLRKMEEKHLNKPVRNKVKCDLSAMMLAFKEVLQGEKLE